MIIDPLQDDKPNIAAGDAEPRGESLQNDGNDISDMLQRSLNIDHDLPPPSYDAVATFPVPHPQLQTDVQVFYNVPPENAPPVDVKDRSLFSEDRDPRSNLQRSPSAFSAFYSTPGSSATGPGPSSERSLSSGPNPPGAVPPARTPGEMHHFTPLVLHSRSQRLADGFHSMPPPTDIHPHPFVTCDIREEDWTSFLEAIKYSAAAQSPQATPDTNDSGSGSGSGFSRFFNRSKHSLPSSSSSSAFPTAGPSSLPANSSPSRTPQNNASIEPGTLVDTWNVQFFRPRGLDIVLARGTRRLNGLSSAERARLPPDLDLRDYEEQTEGHANAELYSGDRDVQQHPQASQKQPPAPAVPGGFTPPPGAPPPGQVLQPHQVPAGPSPGEAQSYYNSRSSYPNQQNLTDQHENDHCDSDSESDSSSDCDSEDERDREAQRALPVPFFNSRAERRAYRQQLRVERHARRAARSGQTHGSRGSRRAERRQERMERKMFRLQQKMARRGYGGPPIAHGGLGYGPGGYADPYAMRGRWGPLSIGSWGRGGMGMMGRGMGPGPFGMAPGPGYGYGMHGGHMGGGVGFGGPLGLVIKGFEMIMNRADDKGGEKDGRHNSSRELGAQNSRSPGPSSSGEEGYYRLIVVKFHQ